ncbi:MAG: hypothetical protein J5857_01175 [Treponema sp.]|nr:hypothetical protein [Treponema sp.]
MKNKIRNISDLVLGLLVLTVTIIGYYGQWEYIGEYCFISGIIIGIIFLSSFIYRVKTGKSFYVWVYACCSISTILIFIATLVLGLNLNGAFIFIHIVDPILILTYWIFFCDHTGIKNNRSIFTVLLWPVFYLILSEVILLVTGSCAFPASLVLTEHSPIVTIGLVLAVLTLFLLFGCIYHFGNRFIRSKVLKK